MKISIIAALSENNVIGRNKGIPWNIPEDLKYFFKITKGHHVIMGRNTYQEFGVSKPLPDRVNIILSREINLKIEGVYVMNSLEEAIDFAQKAGEDELFIIGGGYVYEQGIVIADQLYLTRIHTYIDDGHVFFPDFDINQWKLVSEDFRSKDAKNKYNYSFLLYKRK
jgi:dihydrofolate reductase